VGDFEVVLVVFMQRRVLMHAIDDNCGT